MKRKGLAAKVKENLGGNVGSLRDLLDSLIQECHEDNETRRGEEFIEIQGSIKGYRKLKDLLTKSKK